MKSFSVESMVSSGVSVLLILALPRCNGGGVPNDDDITVTVGASLEGFQETTVTQQIVAIARVPVEIELPAQDDDDAE